MSSADYQNLRLFASETDGRPPPLKIFKATPKIFSRKDPRLPTPINRKSYQMKSSFILISGAARENQTVRDGPCVNMYSDHMYAYFSEHIMGTLGL